MSEMMVTTVFRRLTMVRARTAISRESDSPWISPPMVAPRNSMRPALDIQPNLNVVPITGSGTFDTRFDFRNSFTGGQRAPLTRMKIRINR